MVGVRLAALLLFAALPASAQTVRGLLTDSVSRSPLPGAFLTLVDAQGVERARVMTNQAGEFVVTAPAAGSYRLRSKRIGFRPLVSAPLPLGAGETVSYNASIDPIPIPLQTVVVAGERQCDVESGASTAALWDEVREALAAVSWTSRVPAYWYDLAMFKRELTAGGRRKSEDSTWGNTGFSINPIRNFATSDELVTQGYVVVTDTTGWTYRAPDPDVLLSPAFLRTHCFEIQTGKGDNAGLVGLGFTSARDRTVPEITGTLWVDRANSELRALDFKYIRLPQDLVSSGAGGHIEFLRLPSGVWIIRDWWIRMPQAQMKQRPMAMGDQLEVVGYVEQGGSARTIKTKSGTLVYGTEDVATAGPPSTVPPPAPPAIDPANGAPAPAPALEPAASAADPTQARPASQRRRHDPNRIDQEEVEASTALDAYAVVQQARPNWLHQRGAISLRDPTAGVVQVYLDGQQYGDVDKLREISRQDIRELRFLGAGEAQMRYGVGHAGGIIEVLSGAQAPTKRIASEPSAPPQPPPPPAPVPAASTTDPTQTRPASQPRRRDPNRIDQEEVESSTVLDAYSLVQQSRPNWLHQRGAISLRDPTAGVVQVYLNGQQYGDPDKLREIAKQDIREVRFLNAAEAQMRYGVGHAGGVIEVVLR
jgi:carboxypeptidase family protein